MNNYQLTWPQTFNASYQPNNEWRKLFKVADREKGTQQNNTKEPNLKN